MEFREPANSGTDSQAIPVAGSLGSMKHLEMSESTPDVFLKSFNLFVFDM